MRKVLSLGIFFLVVGLVLSSVLGFFSFKPRIEKQNSSLSTASISKNLTSKNSNEEIRAEVEIPQEIPLEKPIPLLWTDDNQGENLIIQSDRRYYDGSTQSTVYFAITNLSGENQNIKVEFEFKNGVGKLKEISPIGHRGPISLIDSMGRFSDTLPKDKTNFYKAIISYPKGAEGEFLIIARGDKGGYGKLDPYFTSGLVGYWSFNGQDISGTTAYDRSGQGNDGTIYGAKPAPGISGQALEFDGVDDYVDLGTPLSYPNAWTYEVWFMPVDLSDGAEGLIGQNNNPRITWGYSVPGKQVVQALVNWSESPGYITLASENNISLLQWHHAVLTVDTIARILKLYVDGIEVDSKTWSTGSVTKPTTTHYLNQRDYKHIFHGLIDEVRIYNRALSAEEITEHYRVGAARLKPNTPLTNKFTSGLVGYWSFNGQDISGTTAYDRSGQGNDGTLVNGPKPAPGISGQALEFDGVDDRVVVAHDNSLNVGTAFSFSAWVYPVASQTGKIFRKWVAAAEDKAATLFWDSVNNKFKLRFYLYNVMGGASLDSASVIPLNTWTYVAGVYNGSSAYVYINGVLNNSKSASGDVADSTGDLWIGDNAEASQPFSGFIDEFRIYNRALSAEEIAEHYRVGAARLKPNTPLTNKFTSGLVGYWSFNGQDISGTTAYDRSGQGNDGTLVNGPKPAPGISGQALEFDGVDDYVSVSVPFTDVVNTFTMELWVYPLSTHQIDTESTTGTAGVSEQKYTIYPPQGDGTWGAGHAGAGISVGTNGISVYEHATNYMPPLLVWQGALNGWTHVIVVYNNKQPSLFVNGEYKKTGLTSTKNYIHPGPKTGGDGIGGGYWGYFHGLIDEVRIYNRALSAEEIQELYRAGARKYKIR